jgi:hypothetical protein
MDEIAEGVELSVPVASARALDRVVRDLVGVAIRDQVWLMFVDGEERMVPLLVPVDDLRVGDPHLIREAGRLAAFAAEVAKTAGAVAVVLVWERLGGRRLTVGEREVVDRVAGCFPVGAIELRAQYLSHTAGVTRL